jgi:3',5'-nucleoside bisphosphate phosphatase
MIELHCHTTYSDGTLAPQDLVNLAASRGVKALAITDHDTVSGWPEAMDTVTHYPGMEIVPGIELSTDYNGRSMHILGFYPDPNKLQGPLKERIAGRQRRAQKMADILAELGCPIEVPKLPDAIAPGRPHIAAALVAAGHVSSNNEAFDRFLKDDGPAFVPYEKFSAEEGIELLRSCGAVPVWAHPFLFRGGTVETVLPELVKAGLMGVEVYHPTHSPSDQHRLKTWAEEYGLVMTGGTDYHGPKAKQTLEDNCHLNDFHLPMALLEMLKEAAREA